MMYKQFYGQWLWLYEHQWSYMIAMNTYHLWSVSYQWILCMISDHRWFLTDHAWTVVIVAMKGCCSYMKRVDHLTYRDPYTSPNSSVCKILIWFVRGGWVIPLHSNSFRSPEFLMIDEILNKLSFPSDLSDFYVCIISIWFVRGWWVIPAIIAPPIAFRLLPLSSTTRHPSQHRFRFIAG